MEICSATRAWTMDGTISNHPEPLYHREAGLLYCSRLSSRQGHTSSQTLLTNL